MLTHLLSAHILQSSILILSSQVHLHFVQKQRQHTPCFMFVCKVWLRILPITFALALHSDTYPFYQVGLCMYTQNCYG